jgi:biopolymer transport protein ExbB/TolQ
VASLAFYALMNQGVFDQPLLLRYCNGHPVENVECILFFIGLAALLMRLANVAGQFVSVDQVTLGPFPPGGQSVADCGRFLERLAQLPTKLYNTYLVRRFRDALEFVERKGAADGIDAQLRHLEEVDRERASTNYAIVRIIIWAIPILGFLGTVIGITMAIANLSWQELENSMGDVMSGLSVAFDTTALALALSMILMFVKYGVERLEDRLLAYVDLRASAEIVGRFDQGGAERDENVAVVRRMSEHVLRTVEGLSVRQADAWKAIFDQSNQQWAEVSRSASEMVRDNLSTSLQESLTTALRKSLDQHAQTLGEGTRQHAERLAASTAEHADRLDRGAQDVVGRLRDGLEKLAELLVEALARHGEVLTANEKELADENRRHLSEVEAALGEAMVVAADRQEQLVRRSEQLLKDIQVALVEAADATVRQQEQLIRQGEVLLSIVDATGQVKKLESSLNENLVALQQGFHFEEMALNLSAAIQLLCARLGRLPGGDLAIDIKGDLRNSQAA